MSKILFLKELICSSIPLNLKDLNLKDVQNFIHKRCFDVVRINFCKEVKGSLQLPLFPARPRIGIKSVTTIIYSIIYYVTL